MTDVDQRRTAVLHRRLAAAADADGVSLPCPVATARPSPGPRGITRGKRLFDCLVAAVLLVVLAPLLLVVAVAVKLSSPGPVLYTQERVGFGGSTFRILKFRSMRHHAHDQLVDLRHRNVADGLLFKVEGDPRVTAVGRLIRRASIDELPQLWNVLRGDMSLVGPRPLAVEPERFSPREARRHSVRPGITGFWQVSGGNNLSYADMIALDLAYIDRRSPSLDLRLLARTIPALLDRNRVC